MVEQDRNVLAPFAQRRKLNLDRVQAEEQVLAESFFVGELVGRYVGRGDHAHVDRNRLVGADRHDLALLEGGQQLGLEVKRQIADLVEEQGTLIGGFEAAHAIAGSAGEGAFHMPEQLGFEQGLGGRAKVDGDHRVPASARQAVDFARDDFLAGAVLAQDQYVGVGRRGALDQGPHALHRR